MKLLEINFTDDDINLFQLDDIELKANALRHSVLPRLRELLKGAVAHISEVYDIDPFIDSTECFSPQFRPNRENPLKIDYNCVTAGLSPKRIKDKWIAFRTKDDKIPIIIEPRLQFGLNNVGLYVEMLMYRIKQLNQKSVEINCKWLCDNAKEISALLSIVWGHCFAKRDHHLLPAATFEQVVLRAYFEKREMFSLCSAPLTLPVNNQHDISAITSYFLTLYPIYEGLIDLAKGTMPKLNERIDQLNLYLLKLMQLFASDEQCNSEINADVAETAKLAAKKKIRVMPAMRWRVFQRDNWKCVSCGRGSAEGAILEVDHIQPKSLGGSNSIDNYQTLCRECNIGKSNRDNTDLRSFS